jgi:hypothetical protein
MHTGSFVDWLTLLVLSLNARFIWLYLKETNKIRIANEAQLEAQIRPAIVVRVGPLQELELINLGKGPALQVRLSAIEPGSMGKRDLDPLADDIELIEAGGKQEGTTVRTTGALPVFPSTCVLKGRSLQCQYSSLSGHTYWTVVDFDGGHKNKLIATRFYSTLDTRLDPCRVPVCELAE